MEKKLSDLNKKQKIKLLYQLSKEVGLRVACDEEWNTIFKDCEIMYDDKENPIIFGLSGSETEKEYKWRRDIN